MTNARRRPRNMPTLTVIAEYWQEAAPSVFPNLLPLVASRTTWDEPFCFRCGWCAPTPFVDGNRWRWANGWLERAHLHDRAGGGRDAPENLVPLCPLCHYTMPVSDSVDEGLAWVREHQPYVPQPRWDAFTLCVWAGEDYGPFPGFVKFLAAYYRTTLKARVDDHDRATGVWAR